MGIIVKEMMKIKDKLHNQDQQMPTLLTYGSPILPPSVGDQVGQNSHAMVGVDDVLNEVMDKLIGDQSSRQVIPIVGMGGIGKTTLAKAAYENQFVVLHFDIRFWITVSQDYNVREILLKVALGHSKERLDILRKKSGGELGNEVHQILYGRRYLVVLDDLWSEDVWDEINRFFPDNSNRSRILITTRQTFLASKLSRDKIEMDFLNEHKSWDLLSKIVFGKESCPSELKESGRKVAKGCKGLPLSICVMGGLLAKSKRTQKDWASIAEKLNSSVKLEYEEQCLNILRTSFDHMPVHLKPCFLYMGTFPEDREIHKSILIQMWVAEGFVKPIYGKSLESAAEEYLLDLVERNLILVKRLGSRGKIKVCNIHDVIRDLSIREAKKEKFLSVLTEVNRGFERLRNLQCRFAYHPNIELHSLNLCWNLQTLICRSDEPFDIWKMHHLRHVKIPHLLQPPPDGSTDKQDHEIVLQNLHTLLSVVNLKCSEEVVRRIPNIKRLKMIYDGMDGRMSDYCLWNLGCLQKLESLSCSFKECRSMSFVSARWPRTRSELLHNFTFPRFLLKLKLHAACLHWEDVTEKIGSLPLLQVLKLRYCVQGSEWNVVEGKFKGLRFLELILGDMEYWTAEGDHFPSLEHLYLEGFYWLKEIPSGIGDAPKLRSIKLISCGEFAVNSAQKIVDEQEQLRNADLEAIVYNSDSKKYEKLHPNVEEEAEEE